MCILISVHFIKIFSPNYLKIIFFFFVLSWVYKNSIGHDLLNS